jgi:hypothetical protein
LSPGFIKGLIVTFIVFGFLSLAWGVFYLFRADSRIKAAHAFLRGALSILLWSVAYYFFWRGFFHDFWAIVLFLGFSGASALLEIVLIRKFKKAFQQQPMTDAVWQQKKTTKRQVILIITLMPGLVMLIPAIVFTIVAPEVFPLYWWAVLIVAFSLMGFVFGSREWNANETKFGSRDTPRPPKQ